MTIGELIAHERAKLGMSQRRLAMLIGVSNTYVARFEAGLTPFPEKRIADLPEPLRQFVSDWFVDHHKAAIRRLRNAGC